jgi:hypothetical protein
MKKTISILIILFCLFSCSDKKFDSKKWKTNKDEQYYMLNDLVESKRFLGKTKKEIIALLDTVDIKQFKYSDNFWMYIVSIPYPVPLTKTPVEVIDIEFENEKVKNVTKREN